ncbi:hypothetical protein [Sphingomonas sp. ERG5]|uniref:hypothetical protein n=1 Tax=Sphingomonas sp. ERG5 TaxID=1381597 RepID=UPI00054BE80C|nr:hypothetical protein [Sphingomonas sp. ERG5]
MAVLVEGLSVVVRGGSVAHHYRGGIKAFIADVPVKCFCADGSLACVSFMSPDDVQAYIELLERQGLTYLDADRTTIDIVVVDQRTGPCVPCSWVGFGSTDWEGDPACPISVCFLVQASTQQQIVTPPGWVFEGSLSAHHRFVETAQMPDSLKLLRSEPTLDTYFDEVEKKEYFTARAHNIEAHNSMPDAQTEGLDPSSRSGWRPLFRR